MRGGPEKAREIERMTREGHKVERRPAQRRAEEMRSGPQKSRENERRPREGQKAERMSIESQRAGEEA